MTGFALCVVLQTAALGVNAQEYSAAYRQAQANDQPLVVMIGADWCPGCVKMKRSVLPAVAGLAKVQLSHIDVDEQPQLARQMLRGTSIPQLIVFSRSESGWKREHFVGPRSAADVEAAIARAVAIQAKAPKLASEETTTASRTE